MNIRTCGIILVASFGMVGCIEGNEERVVTVEGRGYASALPDHFSISFEIESRGDTQEMALRDAAARLDAIRAELPQLEGLTYLSLNNSSAEIRATYNERECSGYRPDVSSCEITGFRVQIDGSITGSPPDIAGNALSLTSELGATSADLHGFYLSNADAIQSQARARAASSAREQADDIAQSLGMRITSVRAVRGPGIDDFADIGDMGPSDDDVVVVTGSRIAQVSLDLALVPIEFESELTVQFDLAPEPSAGPAD